MPCSFCQANGHNITSCQSPEIPLLYSRIKNTYYNAKSVYLLNDDLAKRYFVSMAIAGFQLKQLRAVAIKYVMVNASTSKYHCVSKLLEHFEYILFDDDIADIDAVRPTRRDSYTIYRGLPVQQPIQQESYIIYQQPIQQPIQQESYIIYQQPIQQEIHQPIHFQQPILRTAERINRLTPIIANAHNQPPQPPLPKKYDISITLDESLNIVSTECAICYENITCNGLKINCNHIFCGNCIQKTLVSCNTFSPVCALCREPMKTFDVQNKDTFELVKINCTKRRRILVEED